MPLMGSSAESAYIRKIPCAWRQANKNFLEWSPREKNKQQNSKNCEKRHTVCVIFEVITEIVE